MVNDKLFGGYQDRAPFAGEGCFGRLKAGLQAKTSSWETSLANRPRFGTRNLAGRVGVPPTQICGPRHAVPPEGSWKALTAISRATNDRALRTPSGSTLAKLLIVSATIALTASILAPSGFAAAEPAGLMPPKVELLSTSISTPIGSSVMLMATTSGTPPWSFQWRMNGAEIPGATNSTLSLLNIELDNAGNYTFVLSNAVGAVTSQVARLIVRLPVNEPAPELTIRLENNPSSVVLEWPLNTEGYVLEAAHSLTQPQWTTNVPALSSGIHDGTWRVTIDTAAPSQFYRLRKP